MAAMSVAAILAAVARFAGTKLGRSGLSANAFVEGLL